MKSNLEWAKWGERDPLFAVASWKGKERGGADPWSDEDFYAVGRSDWADFWKHWQHYGVRPGHCLEIGCGAGRMSAPLAGAFRKLTAVDVSQHQLDYARRRVPDAHVEFVRGDGMRLPPADGACDAVFSVHVFQHFERHADALAVFRDCHRVLAPGGSIMVHLPIYELPDMKIAALFRPAIAAYKRAGDVRAAIARRRLARGKWVPLMRGLHFERPFLVSSLEAIGFAGIEFRRFRVTSNGAYHEFVLARRP